MAEWSGTAEADNTGSNPVLSTNPIKMEYALIEVLEQVHDFVLTLEQFEKLINGPPVQRMVVEDEDQYLIGHWCYFRYYEDGSLKWLAARTIKEVDRTNAKLRDGECLLIIN